MPRSILKALLALAIVCTCRVSLAQIIPYQAFMDGPSESPPNASPGTGTALVDYNPVAHTMRVRSTFSGLTGTTTMAHIHAPTVVPFTGTAAVATQLPSFTGFPLGVTAGSMDTTFDMTLASTWNPAFITANGGTTAGAEAAFAAALSSGRAYYNIHTSTFGAGEIRGFLTLVPEPGSAMILGAGALAMLARRARRT